MGKIIKLRNKYSLEREKTIEQLALQGLSAVLIESIRKYYNV